MSSETEVAHEMLRFMEDVFPICRSITGNGVRRTIARMADEVPLRKYEVETGTRVFDWTVPDEWNVDNAFIEDAAGNRIVDFQDNNLHVVNYSSPVDMTIDLDELQAHLHTLPDYPNRIPYRTTYYERDWGFCLQFEKYRALQPGKYRVRIDSNLSKGSLTYAELFLPGESRSEFLVWSHLCHPALANDNLSGLAVTLWWARMLQAEPSRRYSYRFVWGPGTIGSLTWLARNNSRLGRIRHGLVAVLLGRPGTIHYKKSRQGDAMIDRIVARELTGSSIAAEYRDFDPYGYDERQFGSPGIELPVGRLSRVPNGEYDEYHTSADNMSLISGDALTEALGLCQRIGQRADDEIVYRNTKPTGEPQLGRRGLYRMTGGDGPKEREYAMLWLLNQSDGRHSMVDIAERSGLNEDLLDAVAADLVDAGLLERI